MPWESPIRYAHFDFRPVAPINVFTLFNFNGADDFTVGQPSQGHAAAPAEEHESSSSCLAGKA